MHERMQWYVDEQIIPCCACAVLRGTDIVDHRTFGYMDLDSREPLRLDAIFRMFSNTKPITSVAAMMLWEEARFALDDPLGSILPAFADMWVLKPDAESAADVERAATPITMRQLMSHSSGLSYSFLEPDSLIDQLYVGARLGLGPINGLTLAQASDRLASLPLAFHPGTSWRYSYATDVLARCVEVLAGQPFDVFLRERIFEPLGMVDTGYVVPAAKLDRLITEYAPANVMRPMGGGLVRADEPGNSFFAKPRKLLGGGTGLVSTVSDYMSFLRMIINGGRWNGAQLLQADTVRLLHTNQLPDGVGVQFPFWRMRDTGFGLGFATKEAPARGEPDSAIDEYHWGGMGGTHTWIAPRAGIAGMCMTQLQPGFWHYFSQDFKRMVYERYG